MATPAIFLFMICPVFQCIQGAWRRPSVSTPEFTDDAWHLCAVELQNCATAGFGIDAGDAGNGDLVRDQDEW